MSNKFRNLKASDLYAALRYAVLWPFYLVVFLEQHRRATLARRAQTWQQPSDFILRPLARLVLTIFPVTAQNEAIVAQLTEQNSRILYVENHQLLALELVTTLSTIYLLTGHLPRGIMDRVHLKIPLWADLLTAVGAINGDPASVADAMAKGHNLLVLPGGHHEVYRKKSDRKYSLQWRQRAGFARLAVQHQYTIVPISGIGCEDMLHILTDVAIPDGFMSKVIRDERKGMNLPICLPVSYEMQYFRFGRPIRCDRLNGNWEDVDRIWGIREKARRAVEEGIEKLMAKRRSDGPKRWVASGLVRRFQKLATGEELVCLA
ncbi:hypothetical protein SpCBS45565_g02749 [Spizellomyces sp. 'palustris']|nr:hypothetical protein SpCBS45565_g02749 [Spizellomyces sp. 'palustris']